MTTYVAFMQRTKLAARQRRIPTHVTLGLTHRCNLDCIHCYLRDERETEELSTERWLGVLDEIVAAGGLWVVLTGGEPLLRPDFEAIYTRAKQLGLLVTVMTNGTLVDERILELFTRLPPHHVDVSLYARSAETYQAITGRDRCEAVYANVEALAALGLRVTVKSVALRQNLEELPLMLAWADEHGLACRFDGDIWCTLGGSAAPQEHRLPAGQRRTLALEQALRHQHETTVAGASELRYACAAGRYTLHVRPDGGISPCSMDRPVANLRDGLLIEAWNGPLLTGALELLPTGHPCRGCPLRLHCRVCLPMLRLETGSDDHVPVDRCALAAAEQRVPSWPYDGGCHERH